MRISIAQTPTAALLLSTACLLTACGGGGGGGGESASGGSSVKVEELSAAGVLGEQIFNDPSLSASGQMSCASCHNPNNAYAQSNALAVQLGGPTLSTAGTRAVPSLKYLTTETPPFHFESDGTPVGGFNHDGRAQTLAEQAERPLLSPNEMANASKSDFVNRLKQTGYAEQFRQVFGAGIFDTPDDAFARALFAIQQYQVEDPSFHPFDSKYDAFLAGTATLTDAELRGLALFNRADKGNCAACHISGKGSDGSPPLFTDFTYDNIGVPRNPDIPANADSTYFDLGLCGPVRTDLADRPELCGAFKVPTLRNVATRKVFFHNGQFKTLKDALRFYVRRDTNPEEFYPIGVDGKVQKFNDLPDQYQKNVNTTEGPYNRTIGMAPALSEAEIDDVIAFLNTLTDGYTPR
ncbi:cytochrome c peroxidase [Limnobacter sp.]|uniref:cytochrome-c peroxidase n=1 Tax=Limnobacter sp. TaxID=2003368 RepID=UPI00258F1E91|nr:cytochrome c peroxidase [Limnobacter sp.]